MQKDPQAATVFSILLPGAGHLYAGETKKGLVLLSVAVAAPTAGLIIGRSANLDDNLYVVGTLVSLGTWVYALVDAAPAARRANERNGYTLNVQPVVLEHRPGLSVVVRL